MAPLWQVAVGAVAVVLGVAWALVPQRMARLQVRLLYFGMVDEEHFGDTQNERLAGRIGGVVLAILGVVLALGLLP